MPTELDISAVLDQVKKYNLTILGALNAYKQIGQQAPTHEGLKMNIPTLMVAVHLPCDLSAVPESPTCLCANSVLGPAMPALAKALFGIIHFQGRLLVSIPGLCNIGHPL